jgi:hypothetical protein
MRSSSSPCRFAGGHDFAAVVRGEVRPSGLSSLQNRLVVAEIIDDARRSAATGSSVRLTRRILAAETAIPMRRNPEQTYGFSRNAIDRRTNFLFFLDFLSAFVVKRSGEFRPESAIGALKKL